MPRIESVNAELLHEAPQVNVIIRVRDSDGLEGRRRGLVGRLRCKAARPDGIADHRGRQ